LGSHQRRQVVVVVVEGFLPRISVLPSSVSFNQYFTRAASISEQNATNNGPGVAYRLGYGLKRPEFESRSEIFFTSKHIQTASGALPAYTSRDTGSEAAEARR
jgi:hypothetical protein